MITAPCHKCIDRHPGCHGACLDYKDYNELTTSRRPVESPYLQYKKERSTAYLRRNKK